MVSRLELTCGLPRQILCTAARNNESWQAPMRCNALLAIQLLHVCVGCELELGVLVCIATSIRIVTTFARQPKPRVGCCCSLSSQYRHHRQSVQCKLATLSRYLFLLMVNGCCCRRSCCCCRCCYCFGIAIVRSSKEAML